MLTTPGSVGITRSAAGVTATFPNIPWTDMAEKLPKRRQGTADDDEVGFDASYRF